MELMGANGSRSTDDGSKEARCWSTSCRSRRFSNDEHYKPSGRPPIKPTRLEITKETGPVDPTLLSSTVLINSWKAPSTANMTPPITPISTDSSYSVEGFSLSQPTQETLMQIIRCFPFPTPTGSSENSPRCERKRQGKRAIVNEEASTTDATKPVERSKSLNAKKHIKASFTNVIRRKTEKLPGQFDGNGNSNASRSPPDANDVIRSRGALEKLAQVSVDTMAITALPLDCWLKERLKNWVQLSGHEGTIVPATDQTLWKRKAGNDYTEAKAYRSLMQDPLLDGFVPRFYKEIDYKNESFIEIQDLTAQFTNPAIMDIKIGTRTFSECDVQNNAKRADLYQKMIAQNPCEPTEEERQEMAITKLRYMQFREKESSSASLGFRIEAAKMPGGVLKKSFKKVKTRDEVADTLHAFFGDRSEMVRKQLLYRLRRMREAAQQSYFFKHHEVVGSSLLLIYDDVHAGVWMIDFAKSVPVEGHIMDHRSEWQLGNHEDGYFTGLDNLIKIIEEMARR